MMNNQKMAIIIDSGCDVPESYFQREDVFKLPFRIIYKNEEHISGVTISNEQVLARLEEEIPTTSLPTGQDIQNIFDAIRQAGFEKVLVINISSKLSGTYNMLQLMSRQIEDLQIYVHDTKEIGIGSGFFGIDAIECIDRGMSFEDICQRMQAQVPASNVYFSLMTLEYLQKGGRIGLVSSVLGSVLRIKPIISCNDEGVYYTAKKSRGRKQSLSDMVELAQKFVEGSKSYRLAFCISGTPEDEEVVRKKLLEALPNVYGQLLNIQIDASLSIHTGPNLIGIAVYRMPESV